MQVKIGSGTRSREREEHEIKRKKRTNNMLIAMVVIFMCCWMPLNGVLLIREYEEAVERWYYFTLIFFVAHVIAMSSTIYNPFLYAWMNENFKKEFRTILPLAFLFRNSDQASSCYTQYTSVGPQVSVTNRSSIRNGRNTCLDEITMINTAKNVCDSKTDYDKI